jgi:hypothetical protein
MHAQHRLVRPLSMRALCLLLLMPLTWFALPSARAADLPSTLYEAQPLGLTMRHMQVFEQAQQAPEGATDQLPLPNQRGWQAMQLPDHWSRSRPDQGGSVWYMAQVNFAKSPQTPWAIFLPRVIMNAEVWVNGVLVGREGRMDAPVTRNWNTPLLFTTPSSVWRMGINTLQIRVVAFPDNAGGLAPPQLGRADVMEAKHSAQSFWQNDLVYAATISVIALGFFVMALWLRKRERIEYCYFSLGSVLWGVSNLNMNVREAPLPNALWEMFVYVSMVWSWLFCASSPCTLPARQRAGWSARCWPLAQHVRFSWLSVALPVQLYGGPTGWCRCWPWVLGPCGRWRLSCAAPAARTTKYWSS